jgi:acetyl-CoA carboxylase biotin carboxyl carrier protein
LLNERLSVFRLANFDFNAGITVDLKDIRAIVDLMKKNSISEFELEKQDFKIRLKRGPNGNVSTMTADEPALVQAPMMPAALPAALPAAAAGLTTSVPAPEPASQKSTDQEIKSPMIGTIYHAPSPESAPYVEVGTEVETETVVCIIEAMKVMNEIKAEVKGVITEVLIENARPVEFSQPLFKVRPL